MLHGITPVGHTWDSKYSFIKHADGDGRRCIRTRISGSPSRGRCMFFITPEIMNLGVAVFVTIRADDFTSPLEGNGRWATIWSNDDGSYDKFVALVEKPSGTNTTNIELGGTYPRYQNYSAPNYTVDCVNWHNKMVSMMIC